MGRKGRFRLTWQSIRKSRKLKKFIMATKKQLASMSRSCSSQFQDIPVKVRRSLVRRVAEASTRRGARPICYLRQTSLSELYKRNRPGSYLEQMFTSLEKVGQGCFGDVFKAISKEDNKPYAIKVTNDTHAFIDLGEVRRLEKIPEHKNCIKFFCAWQESYRLYIQMELCMTSLDKVLLVDHFIREPQCLDILLDITDGLKHLHDRELIHLDIKPANIMVSPSGVCKLGDFGLLVDLSEVDPKTLERRRTGVSVSEGDGKYVAIEVLRESTYTKAGDIFSLGIMMLEIASDAVLPSSGAGWEEIRAGILPYCYSRRKLSRNFRQLIQAMMLRDHTQRPSVDDILRNPAVVNVRMSHERGERKNYLSDWAYAWSSYSAAHPRLNFPLVQLVGPSPPRRSYPINYVPPASPQSTTELSITSDQVVDDEVEDRARAKKRISRRLF